VAESIIAGRQRDHRLAYIKALTALGFLLGETLEDSMTTRIFNILMGMWLFVSAFVLPQGRGQVASTAICGALTTLFATLTSYDSRSRYLTGAVGALVVVLAFVAHPLGSATFWHNGVMGISIIAGAWADRGSLADLYERDLYGRVSA
jgi:hypothetical protein